MHMPVCVKQLHIPRRNQENFRLVVSKFFGRDLEHPWDWPDIESGIGCKMVRSTRDTIVFSNFRYPKTSMQYIMLLKTITSLGDEGSEISIAIDRNGSIHRTMWRATGDGDLEEYTLPEMPYEYKGRVLKKDIAEFPENPNKPYEVSIYQQNTKKYVVDALSEDHAKRLVESWSEDDEKNQSHELVQSEWYISEIKELKGGIN